jgi:hypothetical protein
MNKESLHRYAIDVVNYTEEEVKEDWLFFFSIVE